MAGRVGYDHAGHDGIPHRVGAAGVHVHAGVLRLLGEESLRYRLELDVSMGVLHDAERAAPPAQQLGFVPGHVPGEGDDEDQL